jgi:hypothetical protein
MGALLLLVIKLVGRPSTFEREIEEVERYRPV